MVQVKEKTLVGINMICKIADLIVEVPNTQNLSERCKNYSSNEEIGADIVIRTDLYKRDLYNEQISDEMLEYLESGRQFCTHLVRYNGFYLHASAIIKDGRAYLFSGSCGAGKTTHAKQWKIAFGNDVMILNDDKPAIRCIDGRWFVYGTPWCGKDGINVNMKVPLAGVCFLKKAQKNKIRTIEKFEALQKILSQTISKFHHEKNLDLLLETLEAFLNSIPVYELENLPEPEAAQLSYKTMHAGVQERGL